MTVMALLTGFAVGTAWWLTHGLAEVREAVQRVVTTSIASLPLPTAGRPAVESSGDRLRSAPRLSLVVLPFNNLGGGNVETATVDAIIEDLTTLAARFSDFVVIPRQLASAYTGGLIDIRRAGSELGVRYALQGTVRRINGALRISVQLISTEGGTNIWADNFEAGHSDKDDDVDGVVRQIGNAVSRTIIDAEAARGARERPKNPDGFDLM